MLFPINGGGLPLDEALGGAIGAHCEGENGGWRREEESPRHKDLTNKEEKSCQLQAVGYAQVIIAVNVPA